MNEVTSAWGAGLGIQNSDSSRWKYLGLEVWRYGEGEAKVLVEELFSRELADVHAHALAPRLLKELALLDDQASERTVNSPVWSTRTHLVEGRGFRFQSLGFGGRGLGSRTHLVESQGFRFQSFELVRCRCEASARHTILEKS